MHPIPVLQLLVATSLMLPLLHAQEVPPAKSESAFTIVRQSAESPASLYDWTVVTRADGRQFLVLTYRRDSLLVSVDLETGNVRQVKTEGFGYGITATPDGKVYIGTSMSPGARLLEYHLDTNTLTECARVDGEESLFWIEAAPDGKIYGGTYPSTLLICYDPSSKELKNLGRLTLDQTHSSFGAISSSGKVYAAVGMKSQGLIEYDPTSGTMRDLWPKDWVGPDIPRVFLGEDGLVYSYPGIANESSRGKYLKIAPDGTVEITGQAALQAMGGMPPTRKARPKLKDGSILEDVNSVKVTVRSPSGEDRIIALNASGGKKPLYSIGCGPGNTIFASAKPQVVFGYDTALASPIDLPRDAMPGEGQGGQVDSLGGSGNILVMTCYRHAKIYTLDFSKPALKLETVGPLGEDQDRPLALLPVQDDAIFIGTAPGYGHTGGAVSKFNPLNKEIRITRNAIPDQSVQSLAASDKILFLGGSVHGGTGTAALRKTQSALLAEFDPAIQKTLRTVAPIEDETKIIGLAALPDAICGITTQGTWFVVDRKTFAVRSTKNLHVGPAPWLGAVVFDPVSQRLYSIVGKSILSAPASAPSEVTVAATIPSQGAVGCGPVLGKDGNLYFGQDINLVRWTPPTP